VQGRSLISDGLCDDFIDVYRGIPKKTWDKHTGAEARQRRAREGGDRIDQSDALDAISNFVKNCMRRKIVEKQIMEENHTFGILDDGDDDGPDKHVEIPSPGVSPDIPVEIEWGDKSNDLEVEREFGVDDFSDFAIGDGSTSYNEEQFEESFNTPASSTDRRNK